MKNINLYKIYFLLFFLLLTEIAFPQVKVSVEVQKDLFPSIAKFGSSKTGINLPSIVTWLVENKANTPAQVTITSEIPSWTYPASNTIDLAPNEKKEIKQSPFGPNLLLKHPETPVKVILKAKNKNALIYNQQKDITIKPADEMVWSLNTPFDTAPLIAAWITPDNFMITNILLNAKAGQILKKSILGSPYNDVKEKVKSIVRAVSSNRLAYLNNPFDFKRTDITLKVNLPQESLTKRIINNIDASVLMASLFEKSGLNPVIVLLPGHSIVGVSMESDTGKMFLLEPSVISAINLVTSFSFEKAFESAANQAESEFNHYKSADAKSVEIIDIKKCRKNGINPLW